MVNFDTLYHQLDHKRIDLWRIPLKPFDSKVFAILNPDETHRARRFYFKHHQQNFAMARAIMRLILSRYVSLSVHAFDFTLNHYGKPELSHPTNIQFNLSHSKNWALLAVGQNTPVGVDLEFFSGREYMGLAEQMFSKTEINHLKNTPASQQALVFFNIWAQKEAFIKACGMGLSYDTSTFSVPVLSTTPIQVFDEKHQKTWVLQSFMPRICCAAALCYEPSVQHIHQINLSSNDVLNMMNEFIHA